MQLNSNSNFCFQLCDAQTGQRSEPFTCTISQLRDRLKVCLDDELLSMYVIFLSVMEVVDTDEDHEFSRRAMCLPLLSGKSFIGFDFTFMDRKLSAEVI